MRLETDFLVVGSGLAGLSFALKVADYGQVVLLTKTQLAYTNTSYAQGGIAAVISQDDSYEKHIQDTLTAGDGLCNEPIVRKVVEEGPHQIQQLLSWGTHFDKKQSGVFDLAREGGHSQHRILHHKDNTGQEIQHSLVKQVQAHPNIRILEHHFAVDIITQHHLGETVTRYRQDIECYGAYALCLNTHEIHTLLAKVTYLATGGIGNIYQTTTNPSIATGDGIAMAYRAKAHIENMEFVQFHPTALYENDKRPSFLITEALRGFGAVLKNKQGEAFMERYDSRGSLAPRDIVARAIDSEMKRLGSDFVYLDATSRSAADLKQHFPNIFEKARSLGMDISKDYIPVRPAAHFLCGGIQVNEYGQSNIRRLYAGGENTSSGLHGANRLASNSLLEAIVFAQWSADKALQRFEQHIIPSHIPNWNNEGTDKPEEQVLITQELKELQAIMSNYVGIVRSDLRLKRAFDRLEIIYKETEDLYTRATLSADLCELRNAINVAYLIIKAAKRRKESRGLHYNIDYPKKHNPIAHHSSSTSS